MPHLRLAAAPLLAVLAGCAASRTAAVPFAGTADPIASVRYPVVDGIPSRCATDDRMPVHRPIEIAVIPNARPSPVGLPMPNACTAAPRVLVVYPSPPAHP